jgi:hypothetical protein
MIGVRLSLARSGRGALPLVGALGLTLASGAAAWYAASRVPEAPPPAGPGRFLYILASDADGADTDFLAVFDATPGSASQGSLLSTAPLGRPGTDAQGMELALSATGQLLASGYRVRQNFAFDARQPERPRMLGTLPMVVGYDYPHSFARLENGNVIVTYQKGDGRKAGDPGGLAEFDAGGRLLRASSAADRVAQGKPIRPRGIVALPAIDRVVTTSSSMNDEESAHVVQVWRLSNLALLATVPLEPHADSVHRRPFEPRVLPDGRSVLINTWSCGLYLATGLDTPAPAVRLVHVPADLAARGCAVPAVAGRFYVLPIADAHAIASFDISDPGSPVEVTRLDTGDRFFPHWLAADPGSDRIVVTDGGQGEARVLVLRLDPRTGALSVDPDFRDAGGGPGVTLARDAWPHGTAGPAIARAAIFAR